MGGVLKDPCPQCLLLVHGGKFSDRQANDFRADFVCALQLCGLMEWNQQVMENVMTRSMKE